MSRTARSAGSSSRMFRRSLGGWGLGLGGDDLLLPGGIELCQMRMECPEGRPPQPRIEFTIAEGRYDGVLGGYHRRPSGALRLPPSAAGRKWILTRALARLQENLRLSDRGTAGAAGDLARTRLGARRDGAG